MTHRTNAAPIDLGAISISVSDYASQGNAVLGIRDSGKSYTATAIAEQLLTAGVPIVAFDPIGIFRNLRNAGTGPGFPIILMGDDGGDLPLDVANSVELMRHAMKTGASVIVDFYAMKTSKADWRRVVAGCVRAMLYENKGKGLRHIFIEEAAEFCPQLVQREQNDVYSEIEKLARMGGNAMLGYTLINQRAEQINKAVLELCDCLFLHRQKGRNSLTALGKWLDFGDPSGRAKIIQALPMLEQGECYVWAGGEEKPIFTKIPAKRTFHPNRREHTTPGKVMPHNLLEGFKPAESTKPAKNRKQAGYPDLVLTSQERPEPERVEVPVFREGELDKMAEISTRCRDAARDFGILTTLFENAVKRASMLVQHPLAQRVRVTKEERQMNARVEGAARDRAPIAGGIRRMLTALAQRPQGLSAKQIAVRATLSCKSGTFSTYLGKLRSEGWVTGTRDFLQITDAGLASLGDYDPLPTGRDLLAYWIKELPGGAARMLEVLANSYPKVLTKETIGERAEIRHTSGTFSTYLGKLRSLELVENHDGGIRASEEFFK